MSLLKSHLITNDDNGRSMTADADKVVVVDMSFFYSFDRLEQERKRQMELERQLEKQREIEREREEQRRKMMEQREVSDRNTHPLVTPHKTSFFFFLTLSVVASQ